jgi:integrase
VKVETVYRYVIVVTRKHTHHVRRYAYYRRNGALTAITTPAGRPLLPGQAGFPGAYAAINLQHENAIRTEQPVPVLRSVEALVTLYQKSDGFLAKAPATKVEYRRVMGELVAKFGSKSVAAIELPEVIKVRNAFGGTATPGRANKAVASLSILLEFSRTIGWRKDNPALRPKRLKMGPGYLTWTSEEFATFMACEQVSEAMKRAVALAFYTGARVGDLAALPRSARSDGIITFTPQKTEGTTRAVVVLNEHPDLATILDAAPASDAVTLLTRDDGKPWGLSHLQHSITDAVATAGLRKGLSFHGLRKGLTAALAESGASDAEVEAVIPHADPALTRHYRKGANQKKMAAAAMARLPGHTVQS